MSTTTARRIAGVHSASIYTEAKPRETLLHIRQVGSLKKYSVYAGDRPAFGTVFDTLDAAEAALARLIA